MIKRTTPQTMFKGYFNLLSIHCVNIRRVTPYSFRVLENRDQKRSECGIFTQWLFFFFILQSELWERFSKIFCRLFSWKYLLEKFPYAIRGKNSVLFHFAFPDQIIDFKSSKSFTNFYLCPRSRRRI